MSMNEKTTLIFNFEKGEDFNDKNFLEVVKKGHLIRTNLKAIADALEQGYITNHPMNRLPTESEWTPEQKLNFADRIYKTAKEATEHRKLFGDSIPYIGSLSPIIITIVDGRIYIIDGGHRGHFLETIYNGTFKRIKENTNDFLESIYSCKDSLSQKTLDYLESCPILVSVSDGNRLDYLGENSPKTMKKHQKIKYSYVNTRAYQMLSEYIFDKETMFYLKSNGSKNECAVVDLAGCLGILGGLQAKTRPSTAKVVLDLFANNDDEKLLVKLIELSKKLVNTINNYKDSSFSFCFRDNYVFKNLYLHALLLSVYYINGDYSIPKNCKEFLDKLENSLNILNSNKFLNVVKDGKAYIILDDIKDGTGSIGNAKMKAALIESFYKVK